MKKYFSHFLILCAIFFILPSCGSKNKEGAMIPVSATYVSVMNLESMSKQLTWEEIKASGWYNYIKTNQSLSTWSKNVLASPKESGINFKKKILFFTNNTSDGKNYLAFTGELSNQRDFDQYNKQNSNPGDIKKEGNISLLSLSNNQLVGWDNEKFVYIISADTAFPEAGINSARIDDSMQAPLSVSDLMLECKNIFSLKEENSLAQNKPFSTLLKEEGDLLFYINGEEVIKSNPLPGVGNMLNSDVFFKDNITTMAVAFEKGEIGMNQRQYASKELMDYFKKNTGSKIDKKLIERIPSQDIMAVISLNLQPEAIQNFIKLTGADGLANMFLQQAGFNLDDISKAMDGNMLVVVSDAKANVDPENQSKFNMNFNGLFAIGVKDEPSFKKIADGARKFLDKENEEEQFSLTLNDKLMVISNSAPFANQYKENKTTNTFGFIDKIDDSPLGVYLDVQKMITLAGNSTNPDPQKDTLVTENLKMWKNIIVTGGNVKNGSVEIKTKINLMDENTNSLKQLNSFIYSMSQLQKKINSASVTGKNVDSLLTAPIADSVRISDTPKQ